MTNNKRPKRDARERQRRTGEPYVAALRRSAKHERFFEADCCANCLESLSDDVESLFCSELCVQTCDTIRYWRRVIRDGRIERPDVREAVQTRVAFLLAGGYGKTSRRLNKSIRAAVRARDRGLCRHCEKPGEEIDHVNGDSPELDNLQLLCKACHHAKTTERMRLATDEQKRAVDALYATRVLQEAPVFMADDEVEWQRTWSRLKKERRHRLLDEMVEAGLDPDDYKGATRAELVDALRAAADVDDFDYAGDPGNYDGGYGPSSYFAHAMAKHD